MTLRFIEGFDHVATSDIIWKWTSAPVFGGNVILSPGRKGGRCFVPFQQDTDYLSRTFDPQDTWIVGCAFFYPGSGHGGVSPDAGVFDFEDVGGKQVQLSLLPDNRLRIKSGSTTLAESSYVVPSSTWIYLETKVGFHASTGSFEVRVNGIPVIGPSGGVNTTQGTGNPWANSFTLNTPNALSAKVPGVSYDDLYIADANGGLVTDFLGDVRVETLRPSGAGLTAQFLPVGSGVNWQCVADDTPDNDTSYVHSGTVGHNDLYLFTKLASGVAPVKGVQTTWCGTKDNAGPRLTSALVRDPSGLQATGIPTGLTADPYVYNPRPAEYDPTGSPWTRASVQSASFGLEIVG